MARIVLLFLIGSLFLVSCFDAPELPDKPEISLKSYQFKYSENNSFADSLIVEINFKDGDGDLGLTSFDTIPPYHEFRFDRDDNDNIVYYEDGDPFSCVNYYITPPREVNETTVIDTIKVIRNENHYNYFLDILVKQDDDTFEKFDYLDSLCSGGLNGRFFPLNSSGKERALEGILRYGVQSGFRLLFRGKTIKLRISIQDRSLNRSNVVESEEILIEA